MSIASYNKINLYFFSILILTVYSFFYGQRFFLNEKFFLFDFLISIYVLSSCLYSFLQTGRVRVLTFTFSVIISLYFVLFPSLFLMVFSFDPSGSISFISQYYFTFTVVPLFLNYLFINNHIVFFIKSCFFGYLFISFLYVLSFFTSLFDWGSLFAQSDSSGENVGFGFRFYLGEFTPNEMGHYWVLFLTLLFFNFKFFNRLKVIFYPFVVTTFLLTLSKTVWLQMLFSSLLNTKKRLVIIFLLLLSILYSFLFHYDFLFTVVKDFSIEKSSNATRVDMFIDSISYLPYSIIWPAFHLDSNVVLSGVHVTSAHNGFLSYISNFGLVSFILIMFFFYVFLLLKLNSSNIILFFLIHIDLLVLIFNPLINARQLWLPLFMLVYFFYFNRKVTFLKSL